MDNKRQARFSPVFCWEQNCANAITKRIWKWEKAQTLIIYLGACTFETISAYCGIDVWVIKIQPNYSLNVVIAKNQVFDPRGQKNILSHSKLISHMNILWAFLNIMNWLIIQSWYFATQTIFVQNKLLSVYRERQYQMNSMQALFQKLAKLKNSVFPGLRWYETDSYNS